MNRFWLCCVASMLILLFPLGQFISLLPSPVPRPVSVLAHQSPVNVSKPAESSPAQHATGVEITVALNAQPDVLDDNDNDDDEKGGAVVGCHCGSVCLAMDLPPRMSLDRFVAFPALLFRPVNDACLVAYSPSPEPPPIVAA